MHTLKASVASPFTSIFQVFKSAAGRRRRNVSECPCDKYHFQLEQRTFRLTISSIASFPPLFQSLFQPLPNPSLQISYPALIIAQNFADFEHLTLYTFVFSSLCTFTSNVFTYQHQRQVLNLCREE
jgi:hypothetical protein